MNSSIEDPKKAARRLSNNAIKQGYTPEALHEYTDESGKPIYWRIRLKSHATGEKWIRPMRFDSEKGYILEEPKFADKKPLYNLHSLFSLPGSPVVICEGEWCADKLIKLGLLATTSGSADSVATADLKILSGRIVTIWRDNDEAGKRFADALVDQLSALDCAILQIEVEKLALPHKGDVVDWLLANPNATSDDITALDTQERVKNVSNELSENVITNDDLWSTPLSLLAKIEPMPYPLEALPKTIRDAVEEVSAFAQAPIPLIASSALAASSLAIQAYVDVKRAEKLTGPVSLFLLTIADSGERKSTCDGFFMKAIRDYETLQAENAKPLIKDYKANLKAWEAKCAGVKDKIRTLSKGSASTYDQEIMLCDLERNKPEEPRVPRLIYGDATPEALKWGLAKSWPSGGVISSEAGLVLGSHGMGRESVMRNLATLNQLWDGADIATERRTSDSFTVHGARFTMALQVQETTLRSFCESAGGLARGTGFFARFLVAWPESTQGERFFVDAPNNWPALEKFNQRISDILSQETSIDESGGLSPMLMPLAPDTKMAWKKFHDSVEAKLKAGGELYDIRDVASKIADNAVRIATLFQVFEYGVNSAIELCSFERAAKIASWYLHEARRFYGELALPEEQVDAVQLDNWLITYCREKHTTIVPRREIQRNITPSRLRKTTALNAALEVLIEADRARFIENGKRKEIHVNPALIN